MAPPLTIGLTGSIAAGKSAALVAFERHGAVTISADSIVHELLDAEPMATRMRQRWGHEVHDGVDADRARIGEIVFADTQELRWLEAQLHPLVRERLGEWLEATPGRARAAVAEIPLLFEGGLEAAFDATVAVVAPREVRARRSEERGTVLSAEREQLQMSEEEKAARADHVLVNDGTPELLDRRVGELLDELTD